MADEAESHEVLHSSSLREPEREKSGTFSRYFMIGGLVAGYGYMLNLAVRYLYPSKEKLAWAYVLRTKDMAKGQSRIFKTTAGQSVAIARTGDQGGTAEDFVALSSVCPHLGCQVHWQVDKKRFFCPCHNGAFDSAGKPLAGPPKAENLELLRFKLKVKNGLLYIQVPVESLTGNDSVVKAWAVEPWEHAGPGHDPCLQPRSSNGTRCS